MASKRPVEPIMGVSMLFIKDYYDEFFPERLVLFNSRIIYFRWAAYIIIFIMIFCDIFAEKGFVSPIIVVSLQPSLTK